MTADPPKPSPGSSSPSTPIRKLSVGSQYTRAFQNHTASAAHSHRLPSPPKPHGPRPPESSRSNAGSSRTKYHTTSSADPTSPVTSLHSVLEDPPKLIDVEAPHTPYRPPEPVIEPPEEHPPGYVPGVLAEHLGSDDEIGSPSSPPIRKASVSSINGEEKDANFNISAWQAGLKASHPIDIDDGDDTADRPQIGPGVLPRRWLQLIHEHNLYQPLITDLPAADLKKKSHTANVSVSNDASIFAPRPPTTATPELPAPPSPVPSLPKSASIAPSLADYEHTSTLSDVWDACPGGEESHQEWYFCPTCWGWMRITANRGELPYLLNMDEWSLMVGVKGLYPTESALVAAREARRKEWGKMNDIQVSRVFADENEQDHLHEFTTLLEETTETRIDRVPVDAASNAFPHVEPGMEPEESWTTYVAPKHPARLFVSCSSSLWIIVDKGLVPGQLPVALVNAFNTEKHLNPGPGSDGLSSVNEAWTLIMTLLANALFKGQRGWVRLENKVFKAKVGWTLTSSNLIYQIGWACRQEVDGLRIGPVMRSDKISTSDLQQMDRYMLRTWVEIGLYMAIFQTDDAVSSPTNPVRTRTLQHMLENVIRFSRYPKAVGMMSHSVRTSCEDLGVTKFDQARTVDVAYDLQIACDTQHSPRYLMALEAISKLPIPGKEELQFKVMTERSLGKYTLDELQDAYSLIGYTPEHASALAVEPSEAPEEYILSLHKAAAKSASSAAERAEISNALKLIGKARGSDQMQRLGGSGQTILSVDEAYAALSAPPDSIDDGLIMQYEMAVMEYPGKVDHYRMCLEIIANAPGQERPGLKFFLQTGTKDVPARKDLPVGLENIGNTCYLNSILQYLYSIKPLRDAVIAFEQDALPPTKPLKAEVERSRRFVRQLRLLYLQLYKSELSAVRPDEELAYLAITRPELDQILEPEVVQPPPGDLPDILSIPNIPSDSDMVVDTPATTSSGGLSPSESPRKALSPERPSVLGKRASEDRDDSPGDNSIDRHRHRGDSIISVDETEVTTETEYEIPDDLDELPQYEQGLLESTFSPPDKRLSQLDLKSPVEDLVDPMVEFEPPLGSPPPPVPPPLPRRPTGKDHLSSGLKFGLQQDSAEVLINVLNQLELALDSPTDENGDQKPNLIQSLFSCKFRQQIFYNTPDGSSVEAQVPVESVFVPPIVGVEEEGKDLYDCLAELYLKGADIEYEGKKGYKMDLMDELPPMLYIQMRRSQFDLATGRERKTNTHVAFGQTLVMDRFLANADPKKREESIEITREMSRVRSRLHELRNHKPLSIPATFTHVKEALEQLNDVPELDITPDFLRALEAEGEETTVEINGLETQLPILKARMDRLWEGPEHALVEYELVAVFMHRGRTSGAGHYWTYQAHLPDHSDKFYKYNDAEVTEVSASEVLQDRTGSDANPALLCYVRKGRDLIDTLHREVLETESLIEVE